MTGTGPNGIKYETPGAGNGPFIMLGRLFSSDRKTGAVPDGVKVYAIGDIHGRADLLDALLGHIAADAGALENATLVFLGDYVDRGPDSRGVIDRLIALRDAQRSCVFLKGNHEAAMLDFLHDPEMMLHWFEWGGEETLMSYGISDILARPPQRLGADLATAMPPAHRPFLENLQLTHRIGDYLFVHAGIRPGVAIEDQQEEDLLWIRKRFHNAGAHERPDVIVVHGHQPVKKPQDAGWRINVDTGAVWSGRLTALALEGETRRFLTT